MKINIVLYNPEIPQNTGNIMRTCAATNIKLHLIKPLGFDMDKSKVKRSTANYFDETDYTIHESFEDFEKNHKGRYYFVTRYGQKPHTAVDYTESDEDIYIIFGSESSGMPKELLKGNFNNCLRLPMTNKVRSLNLSNCAAILAYEVLRQFDYPGLSIEEPEELKGKDYLLK